MDGNKNTLRRVALPAFALGILTLPLAGAGAQDAAGQRAMVAEIAQTESQSLTDEIVQLRAIEKWDGRMPTVASSDGMLLDLGKVSSK